jgi:hypothetical protein
MGVEPVADAYLAQNLTRVSLAARIDGSLTETLTLFTDN